MSKAVSSSSQHLVMIRRWRNMTRSLISALSVAAIFFSPVATPAQPEAVCCTVCEYPCTIAQYMALGHGLEYLSDCSGGNPDAHVRFFRVIDGSATWDVVFELGTEKYVVEIGETPDGPWFTAAEDAAGVGVHEVELEIEGFQFARLVEVERNGSRQVLRLDTAHSKHEIDAMSRAAKRVWSGADPHTKLPVRSARQGMVTCTEFAAQPSYVIFTTTSLLQEVDCTIAVYREEQGQRVRIVDIMQFSPETVMEDVRQYIRDCYEDFGTRYFHLIGSWEDDFSSEMWNATDELRRKRDAYRGRVRTSNRTSASIPTFLIPFPEQFQNASSMPYVYSDQPYGDVDDDGVPDVVVTRWPVEDDPGVYALYTKILEHDLFAGIPENASFLSSDHPAATSPEVVRAMVEDAVEKLDDVAPQQSASTFYESDHIGSSNPDVATHLNSGRPDLVFILSSFSGNGAPGSFFDSEDAIPWTMGMLDPFNYSRLIVAASCYSADFSSPGSRCIEFLTEPYLGAMTWVGPTAGTVQTANHAITLRLIEELYGHPHRPMADSWLAAMQRVHSDIASYPELYSTVASYVFLGDPLTPVVPTPSSQLTANVRFAGTNPNLYPMPTALAVGCPQGDGDTIVVEVLFDEANVVADLPAGVLTLSQPVNGSVIFFPEITPVHADSATSLVAQTDQHRTTFTVSSFSGCGVDSALVSLYGIPLGYAHLSVKSYDVDTGESTQGIVNLQDFAVMGGAFVSTQCDCVYAKDYEPCVDYAMPDTTVNLVDLAEWWPHYNHEVHGGGSSPETVAKASAGTVLIEFEEVHRLIGEHTLRAQVSLEGVEPFELAVFALHNTSPKLEFLGWTEAGDLERETLCIEAVRDGRKEVVVGVLGKEGQPTSATTLGTVEFRVLSDQQLVLGDEDLALVTADLLSTGSQRALAVSSMDVRRAVASVAYENALAQNYPNPFNPTTTISFSLARSAYATLSIYDVRGSLVRRLVDERRDRGIHRVVWDGTNSGGQRVASGVYFYKLTAGSFTDTKKLTMLK